MARSPKTSARLSWDSQCTPSSTFTAKALSIEILSWIISSSRELDPTIWELKWLILAWVNLLVKETRKLTWVHTVEPSTSLHPRSSKDKDMTRCVTFGVWELLPISCCRVCLHLPGKMTFKFSLKSWVAIIHSTIQLGIACLRRRKTGSMAFSSSSRQTGLILTMLWSTLGWRALIASITLSTPMWCWIWGPATSHTDYILRSLPFLSNFWTITISNASGKLSSRWIRTTQVT